MIHSSEQTGGDPVKRHCFSGRAWFDVDIDIQQHRSGIYLLLYTVYIIDDDVRLYNIQDKYSYCSSTPSTWTLLVFLAVNLH